MWDPYLQIFTRQLLLKLAHTHTVVIELLAHRTECTRLVSVRSWSSLVFQLGLVLLWWNTIAIIRWKGKGLSALCFHITDESQGRNSAGSWSRRWSRGHGRLLLTYLLTEKCLACFLIQPRIINTGVATPTMGRDIPHQSSIKKIPNNLAYSLVLRIMLLNQGSLIPDSFYQVAIKQASSLREDRALNSITLEVWRSVWKPSQNIS